MFQTDLPYYFNDTIDVMLVVVLHVKHTKRKSMKSPKKTAQRKSQKRMNIHALVGTVRSALDCSSFRAEVYSTTNKPVRSREWSSPLPSLHLWTQSGGIHLRRVVFKGGRMRISLSDGVVDRAHHPSRIFIRLCSVPLIGRRKRSGVCASHVALPLPPFVRGSCKNGVGARRDYNS